MNKLAAIARGEMNADLVIHNANIANIFTQSYELADIAIYSGKIAGIGSDYKGNRNFDADGKAVIPGLVDGHIHIEDTMMTPENFSHAVSPHGTTAVFADPHEIANVLGMAGVEYMYNASRNAEIDIFYGAPSCVPASEFETPFDELDMNAIKTMFDKNLCSHLGEMMNFPAVIFGNPEVWAKILASGNVPITGHAPGVTGKNLNAYISAGISSDHECTTLGEAREKLSRGMWIMIREGASFHDLRTLLPLIRENPLNAARCMVVSDDITAKYILDNGHLDAKLKIMLDEGIDEFTALRMLTLSPCEYFRQYNRGIIAPGYIADFAILESEKISGDLKIKHVFKNGRQIAHENYRSDNTGFAPVMHTRVTNIPSEKYIRLKAENSMINVIGIVPDKTITETLQFEPKIENGFVVPDTERDIAKIVVLERHNNSGKFGVGFVHGLGIKSGAIAQSVAHDAHNFVVAGVDDASIIRALKALAEMGGGLCTVKDNEILSSLALPVGGLMSFLEPGKIAAALSELEVSAKTLGVSIPAPFMVLSFMCLSVIPELRITDQGYIDITKGGKQKIFVR